MGYTLEQFSAECSKLLSSEPGPAGRQKVCELLREVLKDEGFVAKHLADGTPERKIIYEDPKLGFCILAHAYEGKKESPPHDHGPSWAIYGQAHGETQMSDYDLLEAATEAKPGKVRKTRTYKLTPGMAYLYNEGPTRLIRLEGMNMDKVKRLRFEQVAEATA